MKKENSDLVFGLATLFGVVLFLFAAMFYIFCCVSIPKGQVGVLSWYGQIEKNKILEPGMNIVHPLKTVYKVDCQTQKNEEPANVPTMGGLTVSLKAILLYHVDPVKAPELLDSIGLQYEEKVVDTYFRNAVRDACSNFTPEALYTDKRQEVEAEALKKSIFELEKRGIVCESVVIQEPVLPQSVQDRINAKIGAEQDVQRMGFILQQKKLEAEAKVVEAEGIAKSQSIVKKDLDDNYLRYLWIQALKENHGATIYVPTGQDGMPLVKNLK